MPELERVRAAGERSRYVVDGFRRFAVVIDVDGDVTDADVVVEGVQFSDGTVSMRKIIHGNDGATRIVWLDPEEGDVTT